jgi:DnaJ-class molecular chaperone
MVTTHGLRQNGHERAQLQGTVMEFKDYYKILGVEKTATADEIKKAFRKLARKYHPDVSKEPDAQARMAELNEAQAVLSDPEKRIAYDALGNQPPGQRDFRPPPNWDAGFEFSDGAGGGGPGEDYSDFFEQLFGRARHGGGAAHEAIAANRNPSAAPTTTPRSNWSCSTRTTARNATSVCAAPSSTTAAMWWPKTARSASRSPRA